MAMGKMQKTIKVSVTTSQDLWPYQVVDEIQKVMEEGLVKYPDGDGWKETADFHIARAVAHLLDDEDIPHAFARLMMAMAIKCGYTDKMNAFYPLASEGEKGGTHA